MENTIVVIVKGIILYNDRVLIVKRNDNDEVGAGNWEFVGGNIEFGEELEQALGREVKEEVNLEITIDKILYSTTFKTNSTSQAIILVYKCYAKDDKVKLSEEHVNYKWVSEKELRDLVFIDILKDMDKYNVFPLIFDYKRNQ
ncbi:NUDIX domain-containing protein [Tissierella carlieri]|uniref:NUDIX domain-containing protein n=1 Tax=Tissierella carlieri TaxID=689904 RepID=A0ABT1SF68_9FIRM|nr:NUDIX domain-containing protein [Tissierella carlieri]MCQ4925131.1 NUDIX domain-containing protein [Tissierella carlieri]